uniref:Post-SET domain-containing protein n=1 Tax=Romanomermis culicivorax TaxID=13658 RepID=A0A915ID23_ROMCU
MADAQRTVPTDSHEWFKSCGCNGGSACAGYVMNNWTHLYDTPLPSGRKGPWYGYQCCIWSICRKKIQKLIEESILLFIFSEDFHNYNDERHKPPKCK